MVLQALLWRGIFIYIYIKKKEEKRQMRIKIVTDSASNLLEMNQVAFQSVPLIIHTDTREFKDDVRLDVEDMADYLRTYKGKSRSACPGVGDYLRAYEGYDIIYVVTIISKLSGSYNAAVTAAQQYEEENPGKRVFVLDSYSAGPEMKLHLLKLKELVLSGKDFDTVCKEIQAYKMQHTALVFCLESMNNLANNGRVNAAVAKLASIIGLRVIGDVDDNGLHPTDKVRGERKAVLVNYENMKRLGYKGGKLLIDHCYNEEAAKALKNRVLEEFPEAEIIIDRTRGLCTFYAEKGGLMIGFERE